MPLAPKRLDLLAGTVVLVGAHAEALMSLRSLRAAGVNVCWYANDVDIAEEVLLASAPPGRLELSFADPGWADFSGFIAVVAGAGSRLDHDIAMRARAAGVPVNVLGRPDLSTFILSDDIDHVASAPTEILA